MLPQSLRERFNTSKEELARLGLEFNSEALPLLEKLYITSFWILLNKRAAKKIIKQTFLKQSKIVILLKIMRTGIAGSTESG